MLLSYSLLLLFAFPPCQLRLIKVFNMCPFTTWAGIQGPGIPADGGFKLNNMQTVSIYVNEDWTGGKIWPRTWCNRRMECSTGSCGNVEQCNGAAGTPPFTTAEFSLGGEEGTDVYSVHLMNGYNIPVLIDSYRGEGDCQRAGACIRDPNEFCRESQAIKRGGRTVGCKSECTNLSTEQCRDAETTRMFKEACPNTTTHQYDDRSLIRTCSGAEYVVQFC